MDWADKIKCAAERLRPEWEAGADEWLLASSSVVEAVCGYDVAAGAAGHLWHAMSVLESPIERGMLCGLLLVLPDTTSRVCIPRGAYPKPDAPLLRFPDMVFCDDTGRTPFDSSTEWEGEYAHYYTQTFIRPQHKIGKYRADFLIELNAWRWNGSGYDRVSESVVVECDGHDFHERTKEQASRDRKRDREMQKAGMTVFRFTGADIWADPVACAREVKSQLESRVYGWKAA